MNSNERWERGLKQRNRKSLNVSSRHQGSNVVLRILNLSRSNNVKENNNQTYDSGEDRENKRKWLIALLIYSFYLNYFYPTLFWTVGGSRPAQETPGHKSALERKNSICNQSAARRCPGRRPRHQVRAVLFVNICFHMVQTEILKRVKMHEYHYSPFSVY